MSALGTEFKVNVHVEPIDGFRMVDYDFECELYAYKSKSAVYRKGDKAVKKADDDNYLICVSSDEALRIGRGKLKLKLTAHIPDIDYPDGLRTEIADDVCTGVTIT